MTAPSGLLLVGISLLVIFMMGLALIPTTFVALLGGYFYGWAFGLPLVVFCYITASLLGYLLGFWIKNRSFEEALLNRPKAQRFITKFRAQEFQLVFWGRISPVLPFGLMNFVFAFLDVSLIRFIVAGTMGMLPRTILALWAGIQADSVVQALHTGKEISWWPWLIIALVVISSSFIIRILRRAHYSDLESN